MNARAAARAALALLCCAAGGCRYRAGGSLPEEIRTVGVTMLRNQTRMPGLESEVTRAVISALNAQGRLRVVDADGDPDLVVFGEVESYVTGAVRTDRYGDAAAFGVVITARVSARRPGGEYLFKDAKVTNRSTDPDSGAVDLGKGQSERLGRTQAVRDLGRNVASRILEQGW